MAAGHTAVQSRRLRRRAMGWGAGLLAVTLLALGHVPLLRGIGAFLVIEDPLEPATAIIVLGGGVPFREMEAAELYHAGWAPRLMLVRAKQPEEQQVLQVLGIAVSQGRELSRQVLLRLGVPSSAILIPEDEANGGTLEELRIVAQALRPDGSPVILVTSKAHGRRARLTWHYVTSGRSKAIVRLARRDHFDPSRWWKERRFVLALVREYLGLLNYWLGFPVAAESGQGGREHGAGSEWRMADGR